MCTVNKYIRILRKWGVCTGVHRRIVLLTGNPKIVVYLTRYRSSNTWSVTPTHRITSLKWHTQHLNEFSRLKQLKVERAQRDTQTDKHRRVVKHYLAAYAGSENRLRRCNYTDRSVPCIDISALTTQV